MFFALDELDTLARGILLAAIAVCWVVVVVRIIGLRAFSKMTAFDFVVTVAIGSLLAGASQATAWPAFAQATVAMASLLGVQYIVARLRKASDAFEKLVQNQPVVLMRDGEFDDVAMKRTRVARDDLLAKLREANVLALDEVQAVVLETTGDISVLHGSRKLDDVLLSGVAGAESIETARGAA